MKIDPKHDYKKPLYAAGLATLIGATAVFGTACGPQIAGGMTISETTTAVQLGGDTYNPEDELLNCKKLIPLAYSNDLGVTMLKSKDNKQVFVLGHLEYDKYTLKSEYDRDVKLGLPIKEPINYFNSDKSDVDVLWRSTANILYNNWLNYYVYQITPFDFKNPKIKYKND